MLIFTTVAFYAMCGLGLLAAGFAIGISFHSEYLKRKFDEVANEKNKE